MSNNSLLNFNCIKATPQEVISKKKETNNKNRDEFIRDRDRILYSKEFRRLSEKTQVFINGYGDSVRTRLTHTLEVSQIATTISKALGLDIFLTEAIALGHDLGHTPFGHAGERALDLIMNGCIDCYKYNYKMTEYDRGFKHNLQSVRVACQLEEGYEERKGLNLCNYTLWGMLHHTKIDYDGCIYCDSKNYCNYKNQKKKCVGRKLGFYKSTFKNSNIILEDKDCWTLEAIVVGISDEIAQRHHDIEDGIFTGLINEKELLTKLKEIGIINESKKKELEKKCDKHEKDDIIQSISEVIIDFYSTEYINNIRSIINPLLIDETRTLNNTKEIRTKIYNTLTNNGKINIVTVLGFSKELKRIDNKLEEFIKYRIHKSNITQSMDGKATYIIIKLMKAYISNPQQLPDRTIVKIINAYNDNNIKYQPGEARSKLEKLVQKNTKKFRVILLRKVCDHISGMTDRYAMSEYNKLYNV